MSVTKLPSGRWRAQVYHEGKNVSVSKILGGAGTFATKTEAKQARARARERLTEVAATGVTVKAFWERWTTDPLFKRPKDSSDIHRRERTKAFAEKYGRLPLDHVGDQIVAEWLAGGKRNGTVQSLCSVFNDARSAKAGRLVTNNPFEKLGLSRGAGRRDQQPPSEELVWRIIATARQLTAPSFASWLQVAAFTGMRPGELDALAWENIDFERDRIRVKIQFNAATRTFTLPKRGEREAPLTTQARAALLALPRESRFCFVPIRGEHWTPSSRAYHWKAVRAAVGWTASLYLATRHFAGWYMVNVLEMASEDVAIALGHQDGGELVRRLYGHRDHNHALDRVVKAYGTAANAAALRTTDPASRRQPHTSPHTMGGSAGSR